LCRGWICRPSLIGSLVDQDQSRRVDILIPHLFSTATMTTIPKWVWPFSIWCQKSDDDDDDDESFVVDTDREMDYAKMMDLEDDVLNGYIQEGESRESSSWSSGEQQSLNQHKILKQH
jgi:hypothetical protein